MKQRYGYCSDCGAAVRLGAGNRVLAHNRVWRGRIKGRCSGGGKRVRPSDKKLCLHIKTHAPPPKKNTCSCCGQPLPLPA